MQWRREYRAKRYLETLTAEELNRRAADLVTNLLTLTPAGQIGLKPIEGESAEWHRKWTHVLDEFQARFGPPPNGLSKQTLAAAQMPNATFPVVPPAYLALTAANLEKGQFLLKLGGKAHMEAMVRTGRVRIAPASLYKDPSLNLAVHDDELSFESIAQPGFVVQVRSKPEGPFVPVGGMRDLRMRSTMQTDYYVYCMTHAADHRLFDDFGADACVAITEPRVFAERLLASVKTVLPSWKSGGGRVKYRDPHFVNARDVAIPMTKHFRYAYQQESRMYWVPPEPRNDLEPFFVDLAQGSRLALGHQGTARPFQPTFKYRRVPRRHAFYGVNCGAVRHGEAGKCAVTGPARGPRQ
jgi:hypothetical protein